MLLMDEPSVVITGRFDPELLAVEHANFVRAQSQRIWKLVRTGLQTELAPPQQACTLLAQAIGALEQWIQQRAKKYSQARWLWMLRRTPAFVFEGSLSTTLGYDKLLAEVLTGHCAPRPGTMRLVRGQILYDLDAKILDDLTSLCLATRTLSDLHRTYRWAAKGAEVEFSPHTLPCQQCSEELRDSVQIYDHRHEAKTTITSRLGTGSVVAGPLRLKETDDLLGVNLIQPQFLEWPGVLLGRAAGNTTDECSVLTRYLPFSLNSRDVLALGAVESRQIGSLILLLRAAWLQVFTHVAKLQPIVTLGYMVFEQHDLARVIEEAQHDIEARLVGGLRSADEVIKDLSEMHGQLWPLLAGPVLRREGSIIWVDLASATRRFLDLEGPANGGENANARSKMFELAVQSRIDDSEWKPSTERASLRGKTLRIRGKSITDIDALGELQDTLILVSCKSIAYRSELDAGTHRFVRNAASTVENAVLDWRSKVKYLRDNPRGDNFDFTGFKTIHGVVCTPDPVWVPIGDATEWHEFGVRAACSIAELSHRLVGGGTFGFFEDD